MKQDFSIFKIKDLSLSDIPIIADQASESENDFVKVGFSHGNKRNFKYKESIEPAGINDFDNMQMHLQYDHTLVNFNSNSLPKIAKETKVNLLHSIFCEQIIFHQRKSKKKAKQKFKLNRINK